MVLVPVPESQEISRKKTLSCIFFFWKSVKHLYTFVLILLLCSMSHATTGTRSFLWSLYGKMKLSRMVLKTKILTLCSTLLRNCLTRLSLQIATTGLSFMDLDGKSWYVTMICFMVILYNWICKQKISSFPLTWCWVNLEEVTKRFPNLPLVCSDRLSIFVLVQHLSIIILLWHPLIFMCLIYVI